MYSEFEVSLPFFVVSFKAYIYGKEALKFSRVAEKISKKHEVPIIIIPQIVDITKIAQETRLPVFSPHIDPIRPGKGTGNILAEAVKEAGAVGTMLNHPERRILSLSEIHSAIKRADEVGLASMVCAGTPEEAAAVASLSPNIISAEPPELIGTGRSVAKVRKDFIVESVKAVKKVNPRIIVAIGASITTGKDVAETMRLGAEATGAASGIFTAKDPVKKLDEMVEALKKAKILCQTFKIDKI